jgi:23S rRNA (guanosine2251-2'-O)-methyltransferase
VSAGSRRPELAELIAAADAAGVPVREVPPEDLGPDAASDRSGQGVELEAGPLPEVALEELSQPAPSPRTLVALDGVEDPQNVGAIARVAEAAGARGLILTRRRSPPLSAAVARASAGAIEWLPVARVPNLPRALNQLKSNGFWVFGSDPDAPDGLFDLPDRLVSGDRVVVLGAEGRGLRRGIEQVLDHRVRIPMAGRVDSLNVSAAAAVVLFEFLRRSRLATSP